MLSRRRCRGQNDSKPKTKYLNTSYRVWLIVATILFVFGSESLNAQTFVTEEEWPGGFHGLNVLAQGNDLEVMALADWQQVDLDQRAIMVVGDARNLRLNLAPMVESGVPVFIATETNALQFQRLGFAIDPTYIRPSRRAHYFGEPDCPVIDPDRDRRNVNHRVMNNVRYLIANRPSRMNPSGSDAGRSLDQFLSFPARDGRDKFGFLVDRQNRKMIVVSDSSLLNNQMLPLGSNAQFAQNVCQWLSQDGERRSLLMVVNGEVETPVDASMLAFMPPPPTSEEVLDAVKKLPREKLLEFANKVAQVAEDEDMINNFAEKFIDKQSDRKIARFYIFLVFGAALLFGIATYLWQKKLLRKTASDVTSHRQKLFAKRKTINAAAERQLAATVVLNAFCLEIANRRLETWPMFPQGLTVGTDPEAMRVLNEMADANHALRTSNQMYWTSQRLDEFVKSVEQWRVYFDQHNIEPIEYAEELVVEARPV